MSARVAGLVLGIALVVLLAIFGVSLIRLDDSGDVANVVAAVGTAIATVVVAFFGIHVAEEGRRDAEKARARWERLHLFEQARVRKLAATTDPRRREEILNQDPLEF